TLASPLARVEIANTQPYDVDTAFAAQLSSLDGNFNPPRRFLELIGALRGKPMPPVVVVIRALGSSAFPVLQQLYNVHAVVESRPGSSQREASCCDHEGSGSSRREASCCDHEGSSIEILADTPGAAWFPAQIETITEPAQMASALRGKDIHDTVA